MAKSLCDFPEGMLTEILLRLPVKSLLCCKSVCKPWLSIISNPHFVKSQLRRAIISYWNNPTLLTILNPPRTPPTQLTEEELAPTSVRLILPPRVLQFMKEVSLEAKGQDFSDSPVHFNRLVIPPFFELDCQVVGSYNGIICLANFFDNVNVVHLWNPTIRQCRKLPEPIMHTTMSIPAVVGFGYDSNSNGYKVLRILFGKLFDVIPIVQVYSTYTNCWKEFRAPILQNGKLSETSFRQTQIVVNGVLYFDGGDDLVSFDLCNEVFGLLPFPSFIQEKWSDILDFEGSVAMVFESVSGIDLWTLDDVCGHVSWTKSFSIENDSQTEIWLQSYLGAGQFFGRKTFNEGFPMYNVVYDYEKKDSKYHAIGDQYFKSKLKYTESLVSLDGFEKVE